LKVKDQTVTLGKLTFLPIDILDTAGQEEFQSLRDQVRNFLKVKYIRQGEGYIIVYSIINKASFDEVKVFIDQILTAKEIDDEDKKKAQELIPLVVVGNKCDLEDSRQVSFENLKQLSETYGGIKFYEASAKSRKNVDESFIDCAQQVFEKIKSKKGKQNCLIQ
jgi:GTPase SAR1 family protein